jgi:hypothetical protein
MARPARRAASAALLGCLALALSAGESRGEDPKESAAERKKKIAAAEAAAKEEERKLVADVNAAIDKGHAWLEAWAKSQQARGDGAYWFAAGEDTQNLGRLALIVLTLVKCGSTKSDPVVKLAASDMLALFDKYKGTGSLRTYSVSVVLLALDALHNPPGAPPGDSRYAAPVRKKCKYPPEIEARIREIVDWLVDKQAKNVWRYPGGSEGDEDLSNTQYALLALQAAGRCGIDAPKSVYHRVLEYLLRLQEKTGPEEPRWIENPAHVPGTEDRYGPWLPAGKSKARGWPYLEKPGTSITGSMTTAGIACLAIVKERLQALGDLSKENKGAIDVAMVDGLAWMSRNFAVEKNPGQGGWHYYYLYGLERVGAFTALRFIGKHDWYRLGARYLIGQQMADGKWPAPAKTDHARYEEELMQTCFALLFLRRATVPPAQPLGPVVTGG